MRKVLASMLHMSTGSGTGRILLLDYSYAHVLDLLLDLVWYYTYILQVPVVPSRSSTGSTGTRCT